MSGAQRILLVVLVAAGTALAAGLPSAAASTGTGYDISYPQCNASFPSSPGFGIVGVNDGLPFSANPCLGTGDGSSELQWAGMDAALYTNTADPGPAVSSHWPDGQTSPEQCNTYSNPGSDTAECAYDYGWNAAADSYQDAVNAYISLGWASTGATRTPVANAWWLDVESGNSWTSDTSLNTAELQGEADYLRSVGAASIGFYSTVSDWQSITGSTSTFAAYQSWVPGARTLSQAQSGCTGTGFTGGVIALTQYPSGGFDADYQCSAAVTPLGTVSMPDAGAEPTGITVDTATHVAYVDESAADAVAEITGTDGSSFSGTATDLANPTLCASGCALPGLDFPDALTLDASGNLLATNFCVGNTTGVCSGQTNETTVSQQTGSSTGQRDVFAGCSYTSGEAAASGRLFVGCAGSGVVASCSTSSCGTGATLVALNTPSAGSPQPVPSGVAAIPTTISTDPAVIVADVRNSTLSLVSFNGSALSAGPIAQLGSGCEPAYVAIGPASSGTAYVYVACPGNGTIEVGTVSGTGTPALGSFSAVSLPTTGTSTPSPYGIAINAAGTLLAVSDSANDDAVFYPSVSGLTLGPDAVMSVGGVPDAVAIDGSNAFIANETSASVSVVDPRSSGPRGHVVRASRRRQVSIDRPLVAPVASGSLPARRGG